MAYSKVRLFKGKKEHSGYCYILSIYPEQEWPLEECMMLQIVSNME